MFTRAHAREALRRVQRGPAATSLLPRQGPCGAINGGSTPSGYLCKPSATPLPSNPIRYTIRNEVRTLGE